MQELHGRVLQKLRGRSLGAVSPLRRGGEMITDDIEKLKKEMEALVQWRIECMKAEHRQTMMRAIPLSVIIALLLLAVVAFEVLS